MSRRTILVVEDDPHHQRILQSLLHRPLVDLTVVDNASGFLEAIRRRDFDCVVMDYDLPGGCGAGLLASAANHLDGCPVIVISGCKQQEVVVSVLRQGGFDFLSKDIAFDGDLLWQRIEVAMTRSRARHLERRCVERRERNLARLAETDPLTGLANRRYFDRCLRENRWRHDRRRHIATVLIDIDHFKNINDSFGHVTGDEVLKEVAACVRQCTAPGDLPIRWGGEELLILRASPTRLESWLWAERLRREIESLSMRHHDQSFRVSVSGGLVHCDGGQFGIDGIDAADKALYLAKGLGRNQICTTQMVGLSHELAAIRGRGELSPIGRWRALIHLLKGRMGTAQWKHIIPHGERVSAVAVKAARRIPLPEPEIECIRMAGIMHDVGQCVIPEEFVATSAIYSAEEYRLMGLHDRFGAWIADELGFERSVSQHIGRHHSRFDASGTDPSAIRRSGVLPLQAGLLCAADALVAMTTNRAHAMRRTLDSAFCELQRGQGKQFDPVAVRAVCASGDLDRVLAA